MASLVLAGDTSGSITVSAPAVAGSTTQTLVNVTGTLAPVVSGTVNAGGTNPFPSSGGPTTVDFTSIPSWARRITINFAGVSTAGSSSSVLIQIGTSGGIQNTGYLSTASAINNANTTVVSQFTAGVSPWNGASAAITHGSVVITLLDSSSGTWCFNGQIARSDSTNTYWCAGSKILSGTLDRVRITTVNGTDTFDAGSINILYE